MEDRLSPGDAFFGVLTGSWWLGEAFGRTLTPRAPEPALTGLSSWADRLGVLPSAAFTPQRPEETLPALVTARRDDPTPAAARTAEGQAIQDLRPLADPAPVAFRNHVAPTTEHAAPVTATGGAVSAPSSGLITNTAAGIGSRATVPVGGTTMPDSPAALSFLNFVNPVAPAGKAVGQGQPATGAADAKLPDRAAAPQAPSAAAAPANGVNAATLCAARPSAADPWGGDPRTFVPHRSGTAQGPGSCTTSGTGTDQNHVPPPPDQTPDNVLVNDPDEDGTAPRDTQSETTLAVVGNTVLASYNDSFNANQSPPHYTGFSRSTNGGESFTDGGSLPAPGDGNGDGGDPVLAHDNQTGRTYLAVLGYTNGNVLYVWRSDDDLRTFLPVVNAAPGRAGLDKEWLTVDNYDGAGQGNVYLITRDFSSGNGIFLFRSTDHGASFGPNGGTLIASGSSGNVQGAWVTVGPDHAVYTFWFDNTTSTQKIMMRKSTDQGVTFGPAVLVVTLHTTGVNGDLGLGGFRSNAFPQAVVNPVSGDLYVAFDDKGTGTDRADVFLTVSTDGGTTWATPIKVNDDATTRDQWQPALAVNPGGSRVAVFWYDRRNDPGNTRIDRYGAIGTVAGGTVVFDDNFRISDTSFPPEFGHDPLINSVYMGDYDQAVADNSYFYLTWGDNRSPSRGHTGNNQDVRFAKILQIVAGPSVVSTSPGANAFSSLTKIRVSFDEQINPDTLTPDNVTLADPAGAAIPITDIQPVDGSNDRQFDLSFDTQTALGAYTLTIGPDVEDVNGNPMDQNHNGIPGEPDDAFVGHITLQAPKITASTPAVGAVLAPQAVSKVTVTFNQPINPATFTPDKIASFVGPSGDITVTGVTPVTGQNNTQFDIQFAAQSATGFYTMTIGPDIEDPAGHQMDQNGNFIDGEVPDDQFVVRFGLGGPRITTSTQLGSALPNVTRSVRVVFNESMNTSTMTPANVTLTGPSGPVTVNSVTVVTGTNPPNSTFDINFNVLTVTGLYTLTVGPHVRDTFGNEMDQNNNLVPGEPDDAFVGTLGVQGPRITAQSISGGLTPQAVSTIRVTFNVSMDPTTFTAAKVVSFTRTNGTVVTDLRSTITSVTVVTGTNPPNSQYNINFQSTGATGRYTLLIGPDIRDTFGNPMDQNLNLVPGEVPGDQYPATFTILGPRITTSTQLGSTLPNSTRSLTVTFNEAMSPATFTTGAVSLVGPGGPVTITSITPLSGNTQFTINFNPLTVTGLYTLTVGPHIRDTFGNEMDQNNNLILGEVPGDQFVATLGVLGPRVTGQTPSGVLTPQTVNTVRVNFNEAINPATFTTDKILSFTRANGPNVTDLLPTITGIVPQTGNTSFNINFQGTAMTGLYTLVLAADLRDTFGNALDQNNNLVPGEVPGDQYFGTFAIQGPRVTASTPSGSVVPPVGGVSGVQVTFNEPMNPATFTPDQIVSFTRTNGPDVTDLSDTIISVVPVAGSNNTRFNINFQAVGTIGQYALVIGPDILDPAGNAMDQNNNLNPGEVPGDRYTATFTLLGPRVTASSPTGNILGQVNSVRVTFNEVMDPSTFTPDKVSLTGPNGPVEVIGVFPFGGNNQFDITFASQVTTGRYTLVVGPDVEDYFGNEMDQNNNLVPGEIPGDQFTATFGIQGPRVTASSAGGVVGMVQSLRVTFNESMDPASFTPDKVASFKGPGGVDVPVTDVQPVPFTANTQFDVLFDPLTVPGSYSMVIGPDIEDVYGNPMDQNNNLIPGEIPGDQFTATFAVSGPQIVSLVRNGVSGPATSVRVTFNEPIDVDTFTPDRVTRFVDPNGRSIAVQDIQPVDGSGGQQVDVSFAQQTTLGTYTMTIGPGIMDLYGNTTTTAFTGTFTVTAAASPSRPGSEGHARPGLPETLRALAGADAVTLGIPVGSNGGSVSRGGSPAAADTAFSRGTLVSDPAGRVLAPAWLDQVFSAVRQRNAVRQPARNGGDDLAFMADWSDPFADVTSARGTE